MIHHEFLWWIAIPIHLTRGNPEILELIFFDIESTIHSCRQQREKDFPTLGMDREHISIGQQI